MADGMNSVEHPQVPKRPFVNTKQALVLARRLFGLWVAEDDSAVKELDSYVDRNFYMKGTLTDRKEENGPTEFVLKITNHTISGEEGLIAAQSSLMQFLAKRGLCCQQPIYSRFGGTEVMCKIPRENLLANEVTAESKNHSPLDTEPKGHFIGGVGLFNGEEYDSQKFFICAVRLLTFIPGKVLCDVPWTEDMLYQMGRWMGEISLALQKFDHPALNDRKNLWDFLNIAPIENCVHAVSDNHHKELVLQVCKRFTAEVLPKLPNLKRHVIHGDMSEHNIIVCDSMNDSSGRYDFGLIDFGEFNKLYRVSDIAIALMYTMTVDMDIPCGRLEAAGQVLAGYHSTYPLSKLEVDVLYLCVAVRFSQSLVYGAYGYKYVDPGNEYMLYTARRGWKVFQEFLETSKDGVLELWNTLAISRNARLL